MKTALILLLLCSTADAGRCRGRCAYKYQRACNRAALIQQGVPRMRAEATLNFSRGFLNFSKPFGFFGGLGFF